MAGRTKYKYRIKQGRATTSVHHDLGCDHHNPASLIFVWKSFSDSTHTLAVDRDGNERSDGTRSLLNCSDASRGNSVGRWSIDTTASRELPSLLTGLRTITHQNICHSHCNCWLVECRVGAIDRYRVKWIRSVATDVHNHRQ